MPGQSYYTSGIETTIDGKRCVFTADNFFHQDQFSGSGGWMGLNRSSPAVYATSAKKVLDIAPEWVLAEHGGPYNFDKEDYRRRVKWGEAAGKACDTLCVSGDHLRDWTPHRVTVEPVLQTAKPGDTIEVVVTVATTRTGRDNVTLQGRGLFSDQSVSPRANAGAVSERVRLKLAATIPQGRHVFAARVEHDVHGPEFADPYFAVDVIAP